MQSSIAFSPDTMPQAKVEECLSLLRQADMLLLESKEAALACHLSLVIELLAVRLERL
jgi:hypothetical protein